LEEIRERDELVRPKKDQNKWGQGVLAGARRSPYNYTASKASSAKQTPLKA
jgi:hypothetical protein